MSTSPSESETTPEEYRQRALLFADLGRYDDAATEVAAGLAAAPEDAALLATLARVHIAAEQPAEALRAAERAVTAGRSGDGGMGGGGMGGGIGGPGGGPGGGNGPGGGSGASSGGGGAGGELGALVVRAMALTDNRRFAEAAQVAGEILAARPDDAYAQRTGAALLSESRNGQEALNAAWRGVQLADTEAEAHLVLAMVAARLRLFDLAQQAYARALDLDEAIGEAQHDVGIVRLERRRWARALEDLADEAALGTTAPRVPEPEAEVGPAGDAQGFRQPRETEPEKPRETESGQAREDKTGQAREDKTGQAREDTTTGRGREDAAGPAEEQERRAREEQLRQAREKKETEAAAVRRPAGPVLDPSDDSADGVRQAVLYGANGVLVAALLTALMSTTSGGASRVWAGLIGVIIFVAVLVWLGRRLVEPTAVALARLRRTHQRLVVAAYLTFAAPLLILGYALVGGLIPLVVAMAVAAAAELLVVLKRS